MELRHSHLPNRSISFFLPKLEHRTNGIRFSLPLSTGVGLVTLPYPEIQKGRGLILPYLRGMTDASVTAEKLLQAEAIKLSSHQPFTWASGWKSPIYCDNRKVLSKPFIRDFIKSELCNVVFEKFADAQLIAGVATAGIAWGAMVADQLKLPFIYVRPKPKEHGLANQIEGEFSAGQKVVVIEDLISTGKSSLQVVEVLRQNGVQVDGMVSIFNYQFDAAKEAFEKAGIPFHSLTNYPSLLGLAEQRGMIRPDEKEILLKWRSDPANWTGVL